jgi:nicotinamide-nucleotide amidase
VRDFVEILVIGDELLSGETCDTNSHWLDGALESIGWQVARHTTVPDHLEAIAAAFEEAARRVPLVISSGGLGPTGDDLTMAGLARAMGVSLYRDQGVLESIRQRFARFQREMTPNNEQQAMIPEGAEVLENQVGTAPGIAARLLGAEVYLLPGVPREVRWLFEHRIRPRIDRQRAAMVRRTLKVIGVGESRLEHEIREVIAAHPAVRWGFRTLGMENHVKLAAPPEAIAALDAAEAAVRATLGPKLYGAGTDTVEQVVGRALRARRETLALAESCTGGLIGKRLTDVPGASAYLLGGVLAYANEVKVGALGVDPQLIERHGAVSGEVAAAMAAGARERLGATWAISATGIAGPDGGSPEKPVGLVYIGRAGPQGAEAKELRLPGDRAAIREITASAALDWLRQELAG